MSDTPTYKGTSLLTRASFRVPPVTGPLTDPTTVILKFSSGDDDPVTWTYQGAGNIIKEAAGVYSAVVPTTDSGDTITQWQGTGTAAVVGSVTETVWDPPIA